ncbi:unnamed protein product [Caenorhabditis auriculariae]|uniref:Uncharacterized protein n=1 Tax=Caenorhabditis auriculariae TaxID=2777116 RepID=A0A8S1H1L0_9PELO|nr:unnamed protein product [Caenorhabditis auriculariae]
MSTRRSRDARDTAKDIILGLAPSGQAPRQPKEGIAHAPPKVETPPRQPSVPPPRDDRAVQRLQSQMQQIQQHHRELLSAEKAARKRLEANQDALQRRLLNSESGLQPRDLDDVKRHIGNVDAKLMMMNNDISGLRNAVDRQVNDLMHINNEIKNRPVVDPAKLTNTTSQLDGKMRDLHGQMMELKQSLNKEKYDRERDAKSTGESITRLQDFIRQQDQAKADILNNLSRKSEVDKLIRSQSDRAAENDRDMKLHYDNQLNEHSEQMQTIAKQVTSEKAKQKERFQKVNEALAALEHHLELGNTKIDKLMNSEILARKQHEKGLLSKMNEIEEKLNHYINGMNKSIEDMNNGKQNVSFPSLDTDALRREMESISADKNKLSMEGLLKLEEKMSRVQQGFYHDRKEISQRLTELGDGDHLNELSAKADNIKHQLNTRLDREEEERYLAIKELQDAFAQLQHTAPAGRSAPAAVDPQMKRDVEECKIAVKKLAESVTTVKNVLDKKITDETKRREEEFAQLRRQQ